MSVAEDVVMNLTFQSDQNTGLSRISILPGFVITDEPTDPLKVRLYHRLGMPIELKRAIPYLATELVLSWSERENAH